MTTSNDRAILNSIINPLIPIGEIVTEGDHCLGSKKNLPVDLTFEVSFFYYVSASFLLRDINLQLFTLCRGCARQSRDRSCQAI